MSEEAKKLKNKAKASLTLLLVAVISITTATYAWFTLSNSTSVQSMEVKVGTGTKLMVSTSDSGTAADPWNGYVSSLDNAAVNALLVREGTSAVYTKGGLQDIRLWPLTSGNGYSLYTENGNTTGTKVDMKSKYYLELSLWFLSSVDMNVYLNGDDSPSATDPDGTRVWSEDTGTKKDVEKAVRVSFTSYNGATPTGSVIYEPNKGPTTTLTNHARTDAGSATQPTHVTLGDNDGTGRTGTDFPVVFTLEAETPKNVVIRLWIEGEDPECTNDPDAINLEEALLKARFRFCGADDAGNFIENTVA